MKKLITFLLILSLIFIFSCRNKKSESQKWSEYNLDCGKAEVTQVIRNFQYFGKGRDIKVKCTVEFENSKFESELTIEVSFLERAYCPFKAGDIVIAKFLKNNRRKIVEMYLFESINNQSDFKWEAPYTMRDVCKGNFPKGLNHKAISAKGKFE